MDIYCSFKANFGVITDCAKTKSNLKLLSLISSHAVVVISNSSAFPFSPSLLISSHFLCLSASSVNCIAPIDTWPCFPLNVSVTAQAYSLLIREYENA